MKWLLTAKQPVGSLLQFSGWLGFDVSCHDPSVCTINVHHFDLTRPPFKPIARQTALEAAADILSAFAVVANLPDKLSTTFDAIVGCQGALAQGPIVVAGRHLSRDIDDGVGAGRGNAYHNVQHFCEVMLGAYFLSMLDNLDSGSRLEVALVAMIHDFHHDGVGNGPTPFRLERLSVSESMRYLVAIGMPEEQRRDIAALVLATEVLHGVPTVRACHGYHRGTGALPAIHPLAPELGQLAADPLLTRKALIVCEADVLPSVGLTIDHALQLQADLSVEWSRPLGLDDKYRFVTKAFPGFIVGTFFQPNVDALRQFLLERINVGPTDQSDSAWTTDTGSADNGTKD